MGSLSNDDDNGSETLLKKLITLDPFKPHHVFLDSFKWLKVGDFSCIHFLKGPVFRFKKKKENSSACVHVLHDTLHQEVSRRSRAMNVKEKYQKGLHVQSRRCFAHKTNCFLAFSLSSSSWWLIKLPNDMIYDT